MTERQRKLFEEHREWAEAIGLQLHRKMGDMNGCDANDFAQLALMGLLRYLPRYRPELASSFHAFAAKRIAGHVLDQVRKLSEVRRTQLAKGKRGPLMSLDMPAIGSDQDRMILLKETLSSPEFADRSESFNTLASLLFGLDATSRGIVYLSIIDELTRGQVASIMGLSEMEITVLLERSVAFLSKQLSRLHGLPNPRPPTAQAKIEQPGLFTWLEQRSAK